MSRPTIFPYYPSCHASPILAATHSLFAAHRLATTEHIPTPQPRLPSHRGCQHA
jgi:hypothetical protein